MSTNPPDEILKLSVAERRQLAEDIWDSIRANPVTLAVLSEQREELDRRRTALDETSDSTVALDEAVFRLIRVADE